MGQPCADHRLDQQGWEGGSWHIELQAVEAQRPPGDDYGQLLGTYQGPWPACLSSGTSDLAHIGEVCTHLMAQRLGGFGRPF